jgi:hypothetical protein
MYHRRPSVSLGPFRRYRRNGRAALPDEAPGCQARPRWVSTSAEWARRYAVPAERSSIEGERVIHGSEISVDKRSVQHPAGTTVESVVLLPNAHRAEIDPMKLHGYLLVSVWIVLLNTDVPRFVTAYPGDAI